MTFRKFSSLAMWATGLSLLFGICGCERMARGPADSTAIDAETSPQIATEAAQWMVNPEPENLEPETSKDFVLWAVAPEANESVVDRVVRHVNEHADGKVAFSFDKSAYVEKRKDLPIGIFDSGIGGLTVLEAMLSLDAFDNDNLRPGSDGRPDFANERFIYLGDQANMPYGNYAAHAKEDFLRELILKDTVFLLGKRRWASPLSTRAQWDKPPVKAIVIACNTATAYGLDDVRQAIKAWGGSRDCGWSRGFGSSQCQRVNIDDRLAQDHRCDGDHGNLCKQGVSQSDCTCVRYRGQAKSPCDPTRFRRVSWSH